MPCPRPIVPTLEEPAMNLLQQLLDDHKPALESALVRDAAFSAEQARAFVPAAAKTSFDAVKSGAVDVDAFVGRRELGTLISKLDLAALGAQCGLDARQVETGLRTLLPLLLDVLKQKGFDVSLVRMMLGGRGGSSASSGSSGGGLADLAGKLFGKR